METSITIGILSVLMTLITIALSFLAIGVSFLLSSFRKELNQRAKKEILELRQALHVIILKVRTYSVYKCGLDLSPELDIVNNYLDSPTSLMVDNVLSNKNDGGDAIMLTTRLLSLLYKSDNELLIFYKHDMCLKICETIDSLTDADYKKIKKLLIKNCKHIADFKNITMRIEGDYKPFMENYVNKQDEYVRWLYKRMPEDPDVMIIYSLIIDDVVLLEEAYSKHGKPYIDLCEKYPELWQEFQSQNGCQK